jgi:hypothetical protein
MCNSVISDCSYNLWVVNKTNYQSEPRLSHPNTLQYVYSTWNTAFWSYKYCGLSDEIMAEDFDIVWTDGLLWSVFKLMLVLLFTGCWQPNCDKQIFYVVVCDTLTKILYRWKLPVLHQQSKFVAGLKALLIWCTFSTIKKKPSYN